MARTLYAAAVERFNPRTQSWSVDIEHVMATDIANARAQFSIAAMAERGNLRIVSVAPAVGVWGKETKDKKVILFT
jgi:hypothetical protein